MATKVKSNAEEYNLLKTLKKNREERLLLLRSAASISRSKPQRYTERPELARHDYVNYIEKLSRANQETDNINNSKKGANV